ncbi:MAG: hypothetical protein J5517_04225 [Eubacterium sp.]|nr:hypothetical protein [Eubacterium sp.]
MGRMVSLNALYDEPAMKPLYARTAYETLSLTTVAASSSGIRSDDIGAYSDGKNLTDQQLKDKAALEALLENTKSSRTSKGAEAMARTEKYELNKITEMNGNGSVSVSANTGGVYASTADGTYLGQFVLTGYCPCVICCGKTNGITASGRPATANHTIAADSRFAFGTQMIINGIVYTVDDRGGAIKGNRIDIFFNTHAEALQFGKKTGDVYLYNGPSTSTSTATTTNTNQNSGGPGKVSMIGDSLMVGATSNLKALLPNANIDGKVGRQQSAGYDIVSAMKKNGTLGDTVVIELGTNGTFTENAGQKLIDNIGSDKKIYWVNTYGPKLSWYADVNSVIAKLCKNNSNVTLIDWCSKSSSNAKLFSGDGIHLTSAGYQTYAQMIYDAIK